MGKLEAVGDMVIVKFIEMDQIGSIFVPDVFKKYHCKFHGVVVSVGEKNNMGIEVGDKLAFSRHEGFLIEHEGVDYLAVKERHIQGVYDED